ncbi:MAG: hypothetical protein IPM36_09780 [Lewinellaceae bacterium]|nr:hypothetical protein [Lewinellaceae bacterium]
MLSGLIYLVSREQTGTPERPADARQQTPVAQPSDSLHQPNEAPPVAGAPPKKSDQTRITAARQLAQEQIASLIPPVVIDVRGQKKENQWIIILQQVDSLVLSQRYTEALELLNVSPGTPNAHRLIRQVYLQQKLNMDQAAIETYGKYMKTVGDPDEVEWGLALVYLAAYPKYQSDFWKQIDAIQAVPGHRYRADIGSLVDKLKNAGIVR